MERIEHRNEHNAKQTCVRRKCNDILEKIYSMLQDNPECTQISSVLTPALEYAAKNVVKDTNCNPFQEFKTTIESLKSERVDSRKSKQVLFVCEEFFETYNSTFLRNLIEQASTSMLDAATYLATHSEQENKEEFRRNQEVFCLQKDVHSKLNEVLILFDKLVDVIFCSSGA